MKNYLKEIHENMLKVSTFERAISNNKFFKTQKGEYGEGDKMLGTTVPNIRKIAKLYNNLELLEIEKILQSIYHEERALALFLLIERFKKGDKKEKENIFNLYLKNIKYINNWDLVDMSAYKIIGEYIKLKYSLNTKNCSGVKFLKKLASDKYVYTKNKKEKLWEKRIAIVATFAFMIKPFKNEYSRNIVFEIVEKILNELDQDKNSLNNHDLIQKACGWMLREYGKRISEEKMKDFLNKNILKIKNRRILLRYSIERLNEKERKEFLSL